MSERILFRIVPLLMASAMWAAPALFAVEPGVDIAVPRVAVSMVDSTFSFHPSVLRIEQGDHVRWTPLTASGHSTVSGAACVGNGLWNESLGTPGVSFTRQFVEAPQTFPYFCSLHCGIRNMVGQVVLTPLIDLTATDMAGATSLSWTGGGTNYRVFRSDNALFTGPNTIALAPDGGSAGTSLNDFLAPAPAVGQATFYLVMNLF